MATLIPNRQLTEIKKMKPSDFRTLRACEVYDGEIRDENYLGTFIPKNVFDSVVADNVRTKAEYLGVSTNSIYPNYEQEKKSYICDECGVGFDIKIALVGHKRSHKKELVEV